MIEFDLKKQEALMTMVRAHEAITGKEPECLQIPDYFWPGLEQFAGIKVAHWSMDKFFTASEGQIIHHRWEAA